MGKAHWLNQEISEFSLGEYPQEEKWNKCRNFTSVSNDNGIEPWFWTVDSQTQLQGDFRLVLKKGST